LYKSSKLIEKGFETMIFNDFTIVYFIIAKYLSGIYILYIRFQIV